MPQRVAFLLILALCLVAGPKPASASPELTLLLTGDSHGEYRPCPS